MPSGARSALRSGPQAVCASRARLCCGCRGADGAHVARGTGVQAVPSLGGTPLVERAPWTLHQNVGREPWEGNILVRVGVKRDDNDACDNSDYADVGMILT